MKLAYSFLGLVAVLAAARLTRTNPNGSQTPLYGGADVDFQGSTEFGGTVVETVSVTVQ